MYGNAANGICRYIFPALGLGTIISKASHVTDLMVEAAAVALAESLTPEELAGELVYPRLTRIRQVSAGIAKTVVRAAQASVSVCFLLFSLVPPPPGRRVAI
jgi:malic enzyme